LYTVLYCSSADLSMLWSCPLSYPFFQTNARPVIICSMVLPFFHTLVLLNVGPTPSFRTMIHSFFLALILPFFPFSDPSPPLF
jgi:hypothetical protein